MTVADDSTAYGVREIEAPGTRVAAFTLEVTEGADAGRRFTIDGAQPTRLYMGKSQACEIQLNDALVSRRHAALEPAGARLRYTDLESLNGTTVNGVGVMDAMLTGGETIVIGKTTLKVHADAPPREIRVAPAVRFGRVIGASPEMRKIFPLCERLAKSDVPVIIEGETGTGKELLAESIHEASARAKGPFIVFDCTAVPPSLVESALFGHERGAFTGAVGARQGVFEQADGGTLLIDEIGDLELSLQSKLLRALERSEVQRVGGSGWIRVNARILCATRRDLEREIQEGRFRDDLYYRLAVARVELPPLRRRTGDVPILVRHFWATLGGATEELTASLLGHFESYAWPGNIRELHNAVAHRIALGDLANIESIQRIAAGPDADQAASVSGAGSGAPGQPDVIQRVISEGVPFLHAKSVVMSEFERRYCEWALEKHAGNVTRASAASGIARRYFYKIRSRSAKP